MKNVYLQLIACLCALISPFVHASESSEEFLFLLNSNYLINYQSRWAYKSVRLTTALEVGGVYFVETTVVDGTKYCSSSVKHFTLFKFRGVGQKENVTGRCGSYNVTETMTVNSTTNLSTPSTNYYDVGIIKVIRIQ